MNIEIDIKGNKFSKEDIDEMLSDLIMVGKYFFVGNEKKARTLLTDFNAVYKKGGAPIITRERNIKNLLNTSLFLYKLTSYCFCKKSYVEDDLYNDNCFILNKQDKSIKVYVYLTGIKEVVLCYNSLSSFLENWYIMKNFGGALNE